MPIKNNPVQKAHNIIDDWSEIKHLNIQTLRKEYEDNPYLDLKTRKVQLKKLRDLLKTHTKELCEVLFQDLGKPYNETILTEINLVIGEINFALSHLGKWTKNKYVALPYMLWPGIGKTKSIPKGLVLIMSPWNYPLLLLLSPLVGSLAAGNRTVLKTSALCPKTSELLVDLIPKYLDNNIVQIYNGHRGVINKLLEYKFDHIFFTGGQNLGSIVYKVAGKNNTPVTLEMGGKSPVYIDETMPLKKSADRIVWGKFINAGQTCVAPDYVLIKKGLEDQFIEALKTSIDKMFNDFLENGTQKIVNDFHFERLEKYISSTKGEIKIGGKLDKNTRRIEPCVILNPSLNEKLMKEEIFGPILPIISVEDEARAYRHIIDVCENPLATYIFSRSRKVKHFFETHIKTGVIDYKITVGHLLSSRIPFGGVGQSGIGSYHGKYSFDTFSHKMPVLSKPLFPDTLNLIYPKYSFFKDTIIRFVSGVKLGKKTKQQ